MLPHDANRRTDRKKFRIKIIQNPRKDIGFSWEITPFGEEKGIEVCDGNQRLQNTPNVSMYN